MGTFADKTLGRLLKYMLKAYVKAGFTKKMPLGMKLYEGSQWWIFSQESIEYILEFLEKNKRFAKKFYYVGEIDEKFFHIILCNSPFVKRIENNYRRYIDWTNCTTNPRVLTEADYEKIITSGMLFCRKVSLSESERLIELLDLYRQ